MYLHIEFESSLKKILSNSSSALLPPVSKVDIHADGAQASKSGRASFWPLQIRISNLEQCDPEVIGIYRGEKKPDNIEEYLADLIAEVKSLQFRGGIDVNNRLIPVEFRACIADAPARAFLLNHKGHSSTNPCSKCHVTGDRCPGHPLVFVCTKNKPRTHKEYLQRSSEDPHFKDGKTPLDRILSDVVKNTPFEYMHSVLLRITKNC